MTPLYHPRPERWPQVSLRGFFVLVTLLCVSLGWWGVQVKWIRDRHAALESIEKGGWTTATPDGGWAAYKGNYHGAEFYWGVDYVEAPWSINMFGEHGVDKIVVCGDDHSKALRQELELLFPEARVILTDGR